MVSVQIERSGFESWPGNCVVFLGKTLYDCLYPYNAFLKPGVQMGTGEFSAGVPAR